MTMNEFLLTMVEENARDFFKAARRVPADKQEWKPLDNGRSVLDLCQECAQSPLWGANFLTDAPHDANAEQDYEAALKALTTVDDCEKLCLENIAKFRAAVEAFPVERLHETRTLQWGTFTGYQLLWYPLWNFAYHEGQINYIQTLLGDKGM